MLFVIRMMNKVTEVCLDSAVENALNDNIHASVFKELLEVAFKHFHRVHLAGSAGKYDLVVVSLSHTLSVKIT